MIRTEIPIAQPVLGPEEEAAVLEVMRSGRLAQGERVEAFEAAFAAATGARHAIATCNGSTALMLALGAAGMKPGDEVITTPLTFIATANAIIAAGARPVFGDVDRTLNLDPDRVEALIGPRTRALLPVHLHGNPCALAAFRDIAERRGLLLIQDACQAIGASIDGQPLGAFGTAVYSLYATKNITSGGEGGMITTDDPALAEYCRRMRHQAYVPGAAYLHDAAGYNFRMTEIQAAIGICQLARLDQITERRRSNAAYLDAAVDPERFPRPAVRPGHRHVYHQYVIRVGAEAGISRSALQSALHERGVATSVHYPVPVHRQPAYAHLAPASLPEAEAAAAEILSLPVHPALSEADLETIAAACADL